MFPIDLGETHADLTWQTEPFFAEPNSFPDSDKPMSIPSCFTREKAKDVIGSYCDWEAL